MMCTHMYTKFCVALDINCIELSSATHKLHHAREKRERTQSAQFCQRYRDLKSKTYFKRQMILIRLFRTLMRAGRVSGRYRGCFKTTVSEANSAPMLLCPLCLLNFIVLSLAYNLN